MFTAHEADYQINDADAAVVVNAGPSAPNGGRPSIAVDDLRRTRRGDRTLPDPVTETGDLALLIYTSGSTGRPKGVMLSHGNIGAMASMMAEHLKITGADHCLLILPLFHVNAICISFLTPIAVGGQLTVLQRFQPLEFLAAIEQYRPTYFSAVPTIYSHLVSQPFEVVADTSSIRFAICGAAPASTELLAATEERFGIGLVEGYGLTEGTCASTANPVDGERKAGTVGVALPGQRVAIMAPDGTLVPVGERGEVVIQGANVMQGYLNRPEATADALGDGWLHTGDVGILDADGYLRIVDRIKDMIIRGGENVYPREIEEVIADHPAVAGIQIIGIDDDKWGEQVGAVVVLRPGQEAGPAEIFGWARDRLAPYKRPRKWYVVSEFPMTASGKVQKFVLRQDIHKGELSPAWEYE